VRIALDTSGIYTTQAGTSRYIRGLIKGFSRIKTPDLEFIELAWPVENFSFRQPQRALRTFYREFIWAKLIGPRLISRRNADLFHSTANVLVIPPPKVKHVATLHDLAVLRNPERFRPWHRWSARKYLQRLHKADRVICISQFTANEAVSLLNLSRTKIDIVYNGCEFRADEGAPAEHPPECKVPDEFFLFVGSLEPGKNLSLLSQAYQLAESSGIVLPPLVLVGTRWVGLKQEGAPPRNWYYLGRQSDSVLIYLYRRAKALLFPSRYEGFGLPVVEAMVTGCPVICSPVSSLPEVGGNGAYFVDLNVTAYLNAMQRLDQDDKLREELIHRGVEQAEKFSWKRCAEETLNVYRRA